MSIRVYTGTGTSRNGSPLLVEELAKHLDIDVSGINENEMRNSNTWKKETSTLIFAGQSVGQFKKALGENVLEDIQNHVAEGAFDYIGICAGAAFASAQIKYRIKSVSAPEPIKIQNTGLAFFNILSTGPCRSVADLPFSGGPENLHLISIKSLTDSRSFNAFHWGGPALIPLGNMDQTQILSCLKKDGTPMAMRAKVGQSYATVYSYHPEINAGNIGRWAEARFLPSHEVMRLEALAARLDGTAFKRFLTETGLKQGSTFAAPSPYVAPV